MAASSETWSDEYGVEGEGDSQAPAESEERKPVSARKKSPEGPTPYMIRVEEVNDDEVKLWLITFTDVIALMLTFFVMLYAMSVPEEDKWEEVSASISSQFNQKYAEPYRPGPQETISIDKIDLTGALSLPYLKSLLEQAFREREVTNFAITQISDRLVIALPDDLLEGAPNSPPEGQPAAAPPQESKTRAAMVILADTVARIKNRIEIVGHGATWEQSMENALRAATIMRQTGYARDIITRAAAPPEQGTQPTARSIDIVILRDNGLERELLVFE